MKLELDNKKRMDQLSKLMNAKNKEIEDNKQEIEDEIVPGSYFYDVQKVEKLKIERSKMQREYDRMKQEYEQIKEIPTKKDLMAEIGNLNSQLATVEDGIQAIEEDIKEEQAEFIGAYYIPEEVLQPMLREKEKLEEQREDIKEQINERVELTNVIDEIDKTENEITKIENEITEIKNQREELKKNKEKLIQGLILYQKKN